MTGVRNVRRSFCHFRSLSLPANERWSQRWMTGCCCAVGDTTAAKLDCVVYEQGNGSAFVWIQVMWFSRRHILAFYQCHFPCMECGRTPNYYCKCTRLLYKESNLCYGRPHECWTYNEPVCTTELCWIPFSIRSYQNSTREWKWDECSQWPMDCLFLISEEQRSWKPYAVLVQYLAQSSLKDNYSDIGTQIEWNWSNMEWLLLVRFTMNTLVFIQRRKCCYLAEGL